MNDHIYDYLIVGHGLAGAVLSYLLQKEHKKVIVIDKYNENSSSQVAAGLVNPITGRRVVKSWMADELIPFAENFYGDLEKEFFRKFYFTKDLLEVITTIKDQNEWTTRTDDPELKKFLDTNAPEVVFRNKLAPFQKIFRVKSSAWLDIPGLISTLKTRQEIIDETFDQEALAIHKDTINYKSYTSKKIIFCEGYKASLNPLWSWLPFLPAKGEIITIECKDLPEEFILLKGIFIIPIGNHNFRVGSNYEWNFIHDKPTPDGKQKLLHELDVFLKIPYEIIDHKAGVRPTVKDRRPILGCHPDHKNVFIFNGLGTKGAMLAPYFASHLIDHIEKNIILMQEVDVKRFCN